MKRVSIILKDEKGNMTIPAFPILLITLFSGYLFLLFMVSIVCHLSLMEMKGHLAARSASHFTSKRIARRQTDEISSSVIWPSLSCPRALDAKKPFGASLWKVSLVSLCQRERKWTASERSYFISDTMCRPQSVNATRWQNGSPILHLATCSEKHIWNFKGVRCMLSISNASGHMKIKSASL